MLAGSDSESESDHEKLYKSPNDATSVGSTFKKAPLAARSIGFRFLILQIT